MAHHSWLVPCAIDNTYEQSRRSDAQPLKLTSLALAELQLVVASAQYLRASLAFQQSSGHPENGIIISQWVDHFRGGIPYPPCAYDLICRIFLAGRRSFRCLFHSRSVFRNDISSMFTASKCAIPVSLTHFITISSDCWPAAISPRSV